MADVESIIREVETLPVEQRALLADAILRTLNRTDPEIDEAWRPILRKRIEEIRSGAVKTIPTEEAFEAIRRQLER